MTDNFIRHFVAFVGLLICGLIYWAGYVAGVNGWPWAGLTLIIVYPIIYSLINAGH